MKIGKFLYHKSNPLHRKVIDKEGLLPQRGEQWLDNTDIKGNAVFVTNSNNQKDWFDSTFDDDIWQIDSSKILNLKWKLDPNHNNSKQLYTQQPIPRNAIKLIYKGNGKPISETKVFIKNKLREALNNISNKIGLSTEDVFNFIEYHDSYRDLYPNNNPEYENKYEEDYYFQSKEQAYKEVNNLLNFFNNLPNPIPVYRTIKVKSLQDIKYDYLGDSWSWDKNSAINFAKNHAGGNVLLIGLATFDNVDWKETLRNHFHFSREDDNDSENELKISDPEQIKELKVIKLK